MQGTLPEAHSIPWHLSPLMWSFWVLSPRPQKGTAPSGWTVWRLFCILIFFFPCERGFLCHSLAIRSQKSHGPEAEKIMEERFKTPVVWQGFGAQSSVGSAIPVRAVLGGHRGAPGVRDAARAWAQCHAPRCCQPGVVLTWRL